jgi:biopolymer transport protein ExbD
MQTGFEEKGLKRRQARAIATRNIPLYQYNLPAMRKRPTVFLLSLVCLLCLVCAVALAVRVYTAKKRTRTAAVTRQRRQFELIEANNATCDSDADHMEFGVVVVTLVPAKGNQRPVIRFNKESSTWENAKDRLSDIYKNRLIKTAFLQASPEVSSQSRSDILVIMRAAGIERVCIVNPNEAPSWLKRRRPTGGS